MLCTWQDGYYTCNIACKNAQQTYKGKYYKGYLLSNYFAKFGI